MILRYTIALQRESFTAKMQSAPRYPKRVNHTTHDYYWLHKAPSILLIYRNIIGKNGRYEKIVIFVIIFLGGMLLYTITELGAES